MVLVEKKEEVLVEEKKEELPEQKEIPQDVADDDDDDEEEEDELVDPIDALRYVFKLEILKSLKCFEKVIMAD